MSLDTYLRNHSAFLDPVGIIAWKWNQFALIIKLIDVLNCFLNHFLLILTALFFFNHFMLFFIILSLLFLNILSFRSITLRNYFRNLKSKSYLRVWTYWNPYEIFVTPSKNQKNVKNWENYQSFYLFIFCLTVNVFLTIRFLCF